MKQKETFSPHHQWFRCFHRLTHLKTHPHTVTQAHTYTHKLTCMRVKDQAATATSDACLVTYTDTYTHRQNDDV